MLQNSALSTVKCIHISSFASENMFSDSIWRSPLLMSSFWTQLHFNNIIISKTITAQAKKQKTPENKNSGNTQICGLGFLTLIDPSFYVALIIKLIPGLLVRS